MAAGAQVQPGRAAVVMLTEHRHRSSPSTLGRELRAAVREGFQMRGHNHVFAAVLLGLGCLLAAPGLAASSLAEVKARGKLIVLCFPHQESPFIRVKAEVGLGHYDGVDYEVMEGFARSLAVALEVRPVKPSFNALLPALLRGDGDVIASEFSVTEERRKQVDFSVPYFTVHHMVVVPAGSAVRTPADLAGKRASTIVGS